MWRGLWLWSVVKQTGHGMVCSVRGICTLPCKNIDWLDLGQALGLWFQACSCTQR